MENEPNAPVRVLLVVTVRYSHNGIARYVENAVRSLDPARVRCDVVLPNEPDASFARAVREKGGEVIIIPRRNRDPFGYICALAKVVRERDEQIVHAHGNSATLYVEMLAAKRGGAKTRIAHSHNTTCRMKLADKLLRRAFYRNYTNGCACGEAAGRWLFGSRPFTVLQNAVDTEAYRYDPNARTRAREALGISPDAFVILHVGTFDERKNQRLLIDAAARLLQTRENARLLLVGEGALQAACEARASEIGIASRVQFAGVRDDVAALMSASDVFALPSLAEGLPFTLIEAQCAGLPCVVSDRVSPEAALTDGVTSLPIGDAGVWAERFASLCAPDRAAASEQAISCAVAAGYDSKRNADELASWYQALAAEARV